MYLDAVNGMFKAQNIKSETHSDSTKAVVECLRNFGHRIKARTVMRLPGKNIQFQNNKNIQFQNNKKKLKKFTKKYISIYNKLVIKIENKCFPCIMR